MEARAGVAQQGEAVCPLILTEWHSGFLLVLLPMSLLPGVVPPWLVVPVTERERDVGRKEKPVDMEKGG